MYMFAQRLFCGIRSRSAFKAGSFSSHSCSLAVHLHDPVADSHRREHKKCFKHNIFCSRVRFRAFLLSFGMPIESGVANERQRTRPRPQKACQCTLGE